MAAPAPSDKVKDKDYTNWLKVTLALYYMKSGLHTFIQSEIDCLHQFLVQKIYANQTVQLSHCTTCNASLVKRNKHTGVWKFQNQCNSYCDVWFRELLALHTNPKSEKIYWANSDVSSWPFSPWECAKVFLPRGQQPTNTGPAGSDAQALMTLLANCTHFHTKLSQPGQKLTHTISTIRNKVMHDGEMKVSDGDRKSFIQQIIQLLEDPISLKSLDDCKAAVSNIHKIDNDSVDVFFDVGLQMTALMEVVNDFRQELGMQDTKNVDNVNSLEEEFRQLAKRFEDIEKKLELHDESTIKRFEVIQKDLELHGKSTTKMFEAVEKGLGLHGESTTKRFEAVEKELELYGESTTKRFEAVEKGLELHGENTTKRFEAVEKGLGLHGESTTKRFETVEKELELYGESTTKRFETVEKGLGLHGENTTKRFEAVEKGLGLHGENTTKRFEAVEKGLELHGERFEAVEKRFELQTESTRNMFEDVKKELESRTKRVAETVELLGERLGVETGQITIENNSNMKESLLKRRPENDDLRQLKNQTEDKLDTLRRLEYIPTTKAEEAKKMLEGTNSVIIKGNPGEGKTTMAYHLIDNEMYRDRRVVLFYPRHWEKVDTDWVDIVILEDIFGRFDLDPGRLQEWMVHLPTIQDHLDAGKLQVIITTRVNILSKACSMIGLLKPFSDDLSNHLTLSSDELKHSEKISILNRELLRHKRNMKEDEKAKCITNFSGLIGFPQCCSLFAGDSKLFHKGPDFFRSPANFFVANINALEATRFLSLAFLFCNGEISEEHLSPETMPKSSKCLLKELASHLGISKKKASITLLRDAYDNFLELYVVKSISYNFSEKPCIGFTHATVYEAVGQVFGDRCPEMVIKNVDSEYLYQRTYTAQAMDGTSQNMFIPVSLYGLLAERMVNDIVKKGLVRSVVKHSALKQQDFLMKLKDELHKGNRIMDFFMAEPYSVSTFSQDLSEGDCITFMQYILQSDEDVVKLMYSHFFEFFECAHNINNSDCWKCKEKQKLLELCLYYKHFDIADKLITTEACYTYVSLCNAARHGGLRRVQAILETLTRSQVFNPGCKEAKDALCRAYISGNQSLTELLLKEGIILNSWHVVDAVKYGDMNVLMKVVEHLKCHNKWNPHRGHDGAPRHLFTCGIHLGTRKHFQFQIPCFTALHITYCNEKFDMTDYLLKNEVKVSLCMLAYVSQCSSQQAVARVIHNLKVADTWDPHCDDASKILENAYSLKKYDVCDLLIQEGVSLTMKNLPCVVDGESMESVNKAIQHLKDTDSWDPKCDDASKALETAFRKKKDDVCGLLIQEGVSLTMKHIHQVVLRSLGHVKTAVKQLKDIDKWDPKCNDASEALMNAYRDQKYDVCNLLVQEGVSLTMKHLPGVVVHNVSLQSLDKVIQHLKDTDNWDPKCDDASKALENAFGKQKPDVYDLLVQEGVSLTMKNFPGVVRRFTTDKYVEKAIQHLKDTYNWDPKCVDASKALENAYVRDNYDVCNLLIHNGVSLTMKNLSGVVAHALSLDTIEEAIQRLKYTGNWDPKSDDAFKALENAYSRCHSVCALLFQEGISLTMKHLPLVVYSVSIVKETIQHLKNIDNWFPKCDDASKALETAYKEHSYDVCDLLFEEGVSLTKKQIAVHEAEGQIPEDRFPEMVVRYGDSEYLYQMTYTAQAKDGTSRNMFIPVSVYGLLAKRMVHDIVKKGLVRNVVKHSALKQQDFVMKLKDELHKGNMIMDFFMAELYSLSRCHHLSERESDLLQGECITFMQCILKRDEDVVRLVYSHFLEFFECAHNINNSDCWKCKEKQNLLELALYYKQFDIADKLITMKACYTHVSVINAASHGDLSRVQTILETKRSQVFNLECKEAKDALCRAYISGNQSLIELLLKEGIILNSWHVIDAVQHGDMNVLMKVVEHLKCHNKWNPHREQDGSPRHFFTSGMHLNNDKHMQFQIPCFTALYIAYCNEKFDMTDYLLKNEVKVSLCMLAYVSQHSSQQAVARVIHNLKIADTWDPHCDDASKILENAYSLKKYDVCDLLIQEGVSLTMKNLFGVVDSESFISVNNAIQHLKHTNSWDPQCDDASEALANAYSREKHDVCDLLIQEGVSVKNETSSSCCMWCV